jgi:hypothetical protein
MSRGIASGEPDEAAADAFGTTPVRSPSEADLEYARALFSRGGVVLPAQVLHDLPETDAVEASLRALHRANKRRGEMRAHPRQQPYWIDDQQRDRAVEMRKRGMSYRAIGKELDMPEDRVASGLREDSAIPAELVRKIDRPEWTEERLRVAAYLRSQGHTYQQIAAVFGYSTGQTIRYALTVHASELGIDPVTGRTILPGEAPPDSTRWAPRLSPWNGAPRTGEDSQVVAERLKRERNARSSPSSKNDHDRDVQQDVLDHMIKRRQTLARPDSEIVRPEHGGSARRDNLPTRRLQ